MTDLPGKIDLHEGDLVLMSFVGNGENGPAFEMIDKVGAPDFSQEEEESTPQDSTDEHGEKGLRFPGTNNKNRSSGGMSSKLLETLIDQRNTLDNVIRQLKDSQPDKGELVPRGVGRTVPSPGMKTNNRGVSRMQIVESSRDGDRPTTLR